MENTANLEIPDLNQNSVKVRVLAGGARTFSTECVCFDINTNEGAQKTRKTG